jgi:hypothetical protein
MNNPIKVFNVFKNSQKVWNSGYIKNIKISDSQPENGQPLVYNQSLNSFEYGGDINVDTINCNGQLTVTDGINVNGSVSASSFLSLHQFQGFPSQTIDIIILLLV